MKIFKGVTPVHEDDRGFIGSLVPKGETIKDVMYITSKAGTIRSNHYHKKDTHYCYLQSGKAEWYEQPVEGEGELEKETIEAGDTVYTPAMTKHAVKFLEDSVLLAFSTLAREDQQAYEDDTVRVELLKTND